MTTNKGVTAPFSLSPPTDQDLQDNERLNGALNDLEVFASSADNRKRSLALLALQEEARDWVREQGTEQVSSSLFHSLRVFLIAIAFVTRRDAME